MPKNFKRGDAMRKSVQSIVGFVLATSSVVAQGFSYTPALNAVEKALDFLVRFLTLEIRMPALAGGGSVPFIALLAVFGILYAVIYGSIKDTSLFRNHSAGAKLIALLISLSAATLTPVASWLNVILQTSFGIMGVGLTFIALIGLFVLLFILTGNIMSKWDKSRTEWRTTGADFYNAGATESEAQQGAAARIASAKANRKKAQAEAAKLESEAKLEEDAVTNQVNAQRTAWSGIQDWFLNRRPRWGGLKSYLESLQGRLRQMDVKNPNPEVDKFLDTVAAQLAHYVNKMPEENKSIIAIDKLIENINDRKEEYGALLKGVTLRENKIKDLVRDVGGFKQSDPTYLEGIKRVSDQIAAMNARVTQISAKITMWNGTLGGKKGEPGLLQQLETEIKSIADQIHDHKVWPAAQLIPAAIRTLEQMDQYERRIDAYAKEIGTIFQNELWLLAKLPAKHGHKILEKNGFEKVTPPPPTP